jgi:hypothetical protein
MSLSLQELVSALERRLSHRWEKVGWDLAAFPSLAAAELESVIPELRWERVLEWALHGDLGEQINLEATFGQPPITLFANDRFYLEALCWLGGVTTIHDHGFRGAFCLMEGNSVHLSYELLVSQPTPGPLQLGTLRRTGLEALRVGQVRQITEGLIHSVMHVGRPAVTLVLRTRHASPLPQRRYWPQGLALSEGWISAAGQRRIQILRLLSDLDDPSFEDELQRFLRVAAPMEKVEAIGQLLRGHEMLRPSILAEHAQEPVERLVMEAALWTQERNALGRLRASVANRTSQLVLVCLVFELSGHESLEMARQIWPERNPRDSITEGLLDLARAGHLLSLNEQGAAVLKHALGSGSFDAFEKSLAQEFETSATARPALQEQYDRWRSIPRLAPLLSSGAREPG